MDWIDVCNIKLENVFFDGLAFILVWTIDSLAQKCVPGERKRKRDNRF